MSYVPEDIEVRRNALALFNAGQAAYTAFDENDADVSGVSDDELETAADAAWKLYEAAAGPALRTNEYGDKAIICSACGAPVWNDDETLDDGETGEVVLRAAIGLPPRPEADEDDEDIEEAA